MGRLWSDLGPIKRKTLSSVVLYVLFSRRNISLNQIYEMVLVCVPNAAWIAECVSIKPETILLVMDTFLTNSPKLLPICHIRDLLTLNRITPPSSPWREMARVIGAWKETVTLCLLCLFTGLLILSLASTTSSSSPSTSPLSLYHRAIEEFLSCY